MVDLSRTTLIEPYGPAVYLTGNTSAVTATVYAGKQEDGSQIQIVNAGSNAVSFASDSNLSLPSTITLPSRSNSSMNLVYSAALRKFTLLNAPASVTATAGTPQSATVNTAFSTALQATVKDASSNPLSGVTVTFTAPGTGASATFIGSATATASTNASGIATAPALTANGQSGSYTVSASAAGVAAASFSLTNIAVSTGGGSGALTGSGNSATGPANLTAEGTTDWVHWGDASLNRKSGVTPQIGNYTIVGSGPVISYTNDPRALTWSDGAPTAGGNNNDGLYINFLQNGFSFTVPADTNTRNLTVHVGGWLSGGTLTAHLSDRSAADYVDNTTPMNGQYDRNYTLSYHAASAGQKITISWVATSGAGNVTLNGAALSLPGPSVMATAGTPQSATVNTVFSTVLQATVKDTSSNPLSGVTVTFTVPGTGASATFSGSTTAMASTNASGIATAPPLAANGQSGSYTVSASAAGVAGTASFSLTNTAVSTGGGSGALTGSGNSATAPADLTAEGTTDWVHWGDTSLNRKSGVTPQISNYAIVGSGQVMSYSNDPRPINWTDGSPTATSTNNENGLYISFLRNGFSFTVPASTNTGTLTVHAGGWLSGGTLTAHLSDGSAADYVDSTTPANGQYDRNYTLSYHAASAGQTLKVSWVMTSGGGNVTLNGAALQ
jgi:hypothetical protein